MRIHGKNCPADMAKYKKILMDSPHFGVK